MRGFEDWPDVVMCVVALSGAGALLTFAVMMIYQMVVCGCD